MLFSYFVEYCSILKCDMVNNLFILTEECVQIMNCGVGIMLVNFIYCVDARTFSLII